MRNITVATIIITWMLGCVCVCAKVLVVQSYHPGFQWTKEIDKSIAKELVTAGIQHRFHHMDTKRHPSDKAKEQAGREAKKIIAAYKPEVVIAVDDNAQAYVVADYIDKSNIQFVFCGVNSEPDKYGYPSSNVTGILERIYPEQTLRMLKTVIPNANQVAIVSDDSHTTNSILPWFKGKERDGKFVIPISEYAQPSTYLQWQKTILRMDKDPRVDALLIPLYHTVKIDGMTQAMAPKDVMRWTVEHTSKPVVGMWSFSVEDGAFFAVTVDPHEHGRVAARMAMEIMTGKKAGEIPIVTNKEGFIVVNVKNTDKFDLDRNFDIKLIADRVID